MNQKRIDRVKGVEKITERGANIAKDALLQCQRRLDEQQARLQQLTEYLQEYAAGIGFAPGGEAKAFALQNYRAFMSKIEQTIDHQKGVVAQAEAELLAYKQAAAEANVFQRQAWRHQKRQPANRGQRARHPARRPAGPPPAPRHSRGRTEEPVRLSAYSQVPFSLLAQTQNSTIMVPPFAGNTTPSVLESES